MDGLRFECVPGCTNCCNTRGFVYVTEKDLARAAEYVGLSAAEFEARYVYRTSRQLRLRKPRNSQCHFLEGNGCRIHPAKPTQCRLFPFWPELVENRTAWVAAGKSCPGIGSGQLVQIGAAMEIAHEMRTAYPSMYSDK